MDRSPAHDVVRSVVVPGLARRTGAQDVLKIGELELHVDVRPGNGSRPPLLMCNGIGASLRILDPLVSALDPAIEVIRFDPPGVGDSPAVTLPYGLPQLAGVLDELLDELGHDEVDLMGYSWGGALAQQFALQRGSRIRNLVLVSTSAGACRCPGTPHAFREMLIPRELADATDAAVISEFISAAPGAETKRSAFSAPTSRPDLRGYLYQLSAVMWWTSLPFLPLIKQRTLVVGGFDDPIVPPANAMILAKPDPGCHPGPGPRRTPGDRHLGQQSGLPDHRIPGRPGRPGGLNGQVRRRAQLAASEAGWQCRTDSAVVSTPWPTARHR